MVNVMKKAKWITKWEPCGNSKSSHSAWCSNCKMLSEMPVGDFCKWCGATMDGHIDNIDETERGDMIMEAYQVRYIKEYDDLVTRYMKLNSLLKKYDEGTLDFELNCPIELLREQADAMWKYIEILWERSDYEKVDLNPITKGVVM